MTGAIETIFNSIEAGNILGSATFRDIDLDFVRSGSCLNLKMSGFESFLLDEYETVNPAYLEWLEQRLPSGPH